MPPEVDHHGATAPPGKIHVLPGQGRPGNVGAPGCWAARMTWPTAGAAQWPGAGPVDIAAPAAYTFGRQYLLGLRADPPRRSARGSQVTAAISAAALVAGIALLAAGTAV